MATEARIERFQPDYQIDGPKGVTVGLEQIRNILPPEMLAFLGGLETGVETITVTDYQSPTFIKAGYQACPESYGRSDGFLAEILLSSGQLLFVMAQKVAQGLRQVGSAVTGGLDLRPTVIFAFQPGDGHLKAMNPFLGIEEYPGPDADPNTLKCHLVKDLGSPISQETFSSF